MTGAVQHKYSGLKFTVIHCAGALESLHEALSSIPKKRRSSMTQGIIIQLQRLADGQPMSKENFRTEGELPRRTGKSVKSFSALKRIPIRGYCWPSQRCPGTWFISHYIYKNWEKLDGSDTTIVGSNWIRIEEHGHDH